jgi:REP element-mobilizing transposase RayT
MTRRFRGGLEKRKPPARKARCKGNAMREPLAYHISWTCYGQWLHGDRRGFVDRQHHTPGEPYIYDDPHRLNAAANRLAEPPCQLTDAQRRATQEAIREACAFRNWELSAVNAQPDHVHVVLRAPDHTGKQVRSRLKDRATRALKDANGRGRTHWWTEGGKVEPILDRRRLQQAVDYVSNRQPFPRVE